MRSIFYTTLLVYFFVNCAFSGEIFVQNNNHVDSLEIKSRAMRHHGNTGDMIKSLYKMGVFSDIKITLENDDYYIYVVERPIINSITFDGNKLLSAENMNKFIGIKEGSPLNEIELEHIKTKIISSYDAHGIIGSSCDVTSKLIPEKNRVDINITINEGKKLTISKIIFSGNENFSANELKSILSSSETKYFSFLTNNNLFIPNKIMEDTQALKRFYFSKGFVSVKILKPLVEITNNKVMIKFDIQEGVLYKVGRVEIEGYDFAQKDILGVKTGEVFSLDKVYKDIKSISDIINDSDEKDFLIEPEYSTPQSNSIDVKYKISSKEKLYVDRIDITGNIRTLDTVIRRELKINENDIYDSDLVEASKKKILALGFFNNVNITSDIKGEFRTLNVNVEEIDSTGTLNLGGGYSGSGGLKGNFSISENNILGTGNKGSFNINKSADEFSASLNFIIKRIFDSKFSLGISVFGEYLYHQNDSKEIVSSSNKGWSTYSSFDINDTSYIGVNCSYKHLNIGDSESDISTIIKEQSGLHKIFTISHVLGYSTLDNPYRPKSGLKSEFKQEYALLFGESRYVKTEFVINYFRPVLKQADIVSKFSLKGGYVFSYDDHELLLNENFMLTSNDIRGFANNGIGPRDPETLDMLGGKLYFASTMQLDFPVPKLKDLDLLGSIFIDSGVLTGSDYTKKDTLIFDSKNLRLSSGFGFTWYSPFGPFRLDFCMPIIKDDNDVTKYINVNFGPGF